MEESIPTEWKTMHGSTHPWVASEVVNAVAAKNRVAGTVGATAAAEECSAVLVRARKQYDADARAKVHSLRRRSKACWSLIQQLQSLRRPLSRVPFLWDGASG